MRTPMPNCDFNKVAKQLRAKSHAILKDHMKYLSWSNLWKIN